ncbi:Sodium-dependent neutral amino acid transporter B(0)AT3 [Triplophysa tibetana]|uniref:Sodium-dependent neutral amino acid transporter B(0)AT3 n=1 Tax=Triplophysa tibetana TaxID=1572043 RepID=A0A5A9NKT7_9TELE|nr:Sodium-dependent neutral amino acid transporter B(0)AT3 [Triplophysa tibetana]
MCAGGVCDRYIPLPGVDHLSDPSPHSAWSHRWNDCERDALFVGCINSVTSLYASIPIFAILGFKATSNYNSCVNSNILDLTNAFDIQDQNITIENYDLWLKTLNASDPEKLSGLNLKPCVLQTFLDQIFNSYVGSVPLLVIAFFELVGIVVFYGMDRFCDDIEMMTGRRPNLFWRVCWRGVSPLLLLVVLVAYIIVQVQEHPTYPAWNPAYVNFPEMEEKPYSDWVFAICVLLSSVPVISIPIVAAYRLMQRQTRSHNSEHLPNPYNNPTFTPDNQT